MTVTTYPADYSSAFGDAIFVVRGVSADADKGAQVQILSASSTTPLGTKYFFNTSLIRVNVASYARAYLKIEPPTIAGLQTLPKRAVALRVGADGTYSASRYVALGADTLSQGVLLSDVAQRRLSPGEVDEITFIPPSGDVWIHITATDSKRKSYTWRTLPCVASGGMVSYVADFDSMALQAQSEGGLVPEEIVKFKAEVLFGALTAFTMNYEVVPNPQGVRLAWVNRYGAVDCYTFPVESKNRIRVQRHTENTARGSAITEGNAWWEQTLSAGLCNRNEAECLAAIATAPNVWRWSGGKWEPCIVLSTDVTTHNCDEPCAVNITLRGTDNLNTQTL